MNQPLNIERCRAGMRELNIEGRARPALVEEAIAAIQHDRVNALRFRYFGIKNYAGFGDQREDHEYGYGPKHGSIVFRIERTEEARKPGYALSDDGIYLLEAYRDFDTVEYPNDDRQRYGQVDKLFLTLIPAVRELERLRNRTGLLVEAFARVNVAAAGSGERVREAGRR